MASAATQCQVAVEYALFDQWACIRDRQATATSICIVAVANGDPTNGDSVCGSMKRDDGSAALYECIATSIRCNQRETLVSQVNGTGVCSRFKHDLVTVTCGVDGLLKGISWVDDERLCK